MAEPNSNQGKVPAFVDALHDDLQQGIKPAGGLEMKILDDVATTDEASAVLHDVLANAHGKNNELVNASLSAGQGTVAIIGGQVSFDPGDNYNSLAEGETARVEITYTVQRGNGKTETATVTVIITEFIYV